ncbi:MAG: polysaccharide biosynthesis protein, partial [Anaerolineales bacterium]|nr:polysaccharide biosynthesis protein [Anaerolineales bacterium]
MTFKRFLSWIPFFRAPTRNRIFLLIDLFLMCVSVLAAFAMRLELGSLFVAYLPQAYRMIAIALLVKPAVYYFFGLYRRLWAYASIRELMLIVVGVTAASVLVLVGVLGMTAYQATRPGYIGFPRPVLAIDWLLSIFLVGGVRFASRLVAESRSTAASEYGPSPARRAAIIGAGDAGALVVREIQKNPQLNLEIICFLDDDPSKQKQSIHGVPVDGPLSDLDKVIQNRHIQEVIIAIPTAAGSVMRQVAEVCQTRQVPFRAMPGIYELIGGKVSINRLRQVNITDLLRRAPASTDDQKVGSVLGGRRVMVTGAGGSIGRELCRQIARWGPSSLILLGHGENSVFEALIELSEAYPALPMHPVIADIRDGDRISNVFDSWQPQVVFHAAAHKHVPLMEVNVEEAITNNVEGTRNLVELAETYQVERFVMISTDKAIRPSSVYGATKRLAELLVLDAAHRSGKPFSVVRFGNVLGSRGSVVPRFQAQIEAGGPITITHPDMRRYFMTIPEAVHLVLQASSLGQGGEVFVLRMGEQIRILDLAEDLVRLSGLEPNRDIDIVFTGIRPGEK